MSLFGGIGHLVGGILGGGPSSANRHIDYTAQNEEAALLQQQNDYFNKYYRPIQTQLAQLSDNPDFVTNQSNAAGLNAIRGYNATTGARQRQLQRYGLSFTPEQQQDINYNDTVNRQNAELSAMATARNNATAFQQGLQQQSINSGRNISNRGFNLLGTSAREEAARNNINRQIAGQGDNQLFQSLGALGMLAMSL